jgi:pyruvate kinase
MLRPSQTKIVATVGPASDTDEKLAELIEAGVDVFRVNTAHGERAEHQRRVDAIRRVSRQLDRPVGILVDLPGPKMRLGEIPGGSIECLPGMTMSIIRGREPTEPSELTTTYEPLIDELQAGDRVLLADGTISLLVERVGGDAAVCRVVQGGVLRSRQGVNLPGIKLSAPSLGDEDQQKAIWAVGAGADFIGLSFVRSAVDIRQLQALIETHAGSDHENRPQVIAKIEKPEAVADLESIVAATDGVMVARGDLGVEIDIACLPMVQKRIVNLCRAARKPVIIATQMLDSMQNARIPTRAEATDVANAILDGADACMLSGETAIGKYPLESVEMMHRIALATEEALRDMPPLPEPPPFDGNPTLAAVTGAAGYLAEELEAKVLVVASASGQSALHLAKHRINVPTIGASHNDATLQRMCLYWGVIPLLHAPTDEPRRLLEYIIDRGRAEGWLVTGDQMVLVFGTGATASGHNGIVVHRVG